MGMRETGLETADRNYEKPKLLQGWVLDLWQFQKLYTVFLSGYQFTFLTTMHEDSVFFTSSATLVIFYLFLFVFLGPHPQHMEVPRLGVELGLQLLAYTTAHRNARFLTTEQGHGLNLCLHGYQLGLLPLSHGGNSFFFFFFCLFQVCTCDIWRFPGQGSNWSCSSWPTPQPQQLGI